ncbi:MULTISPECIES: DUF3054 domain-containing protein [unclassified Gordonia (in: high G+C Gram-positive bacteria)]
MSRSDAADTTPGQSTGLPMPVSALLDAIAVTVFVLIGRSSHHEGFTPLGVVQTLWPFLVGAAAGWSIAYVYSHVESSEWFGHHFRPERIVPAGLVVWVCTVAVGMILRFLLHQGVAVSFVIVASVALGVFLLGWRAVAAYLTRTRTLT